MLQQKTILDNRTKQKLKVRGQRLEPSAQVGKAGVTDGVTRNVIQLLEQSDLLKVRLPGISPAERRDLADQLARETEATVLHRVGRTILLYKERKEQTFP